MTDMNVLYVVHPEQRGVRGYAVPPNMATPMFRHTVPQPVVLFRAQELTLCEELGHTTVEECWTSPGTVCLHGWFCTTDLRMAKFVDELRGERAAVVAWLRSQAEAEARAYTGKAWVVSSRVDNMADAIERGEHRREEEK